MMDTQTSNGQDGIIVWKAGLYEGTHDGGIVKGATCSADLPAIHNV